LRIHDGEMRRFALILIVAASVSACANAVIGPVDHSCHANPARSQGSGCDDRHRGFAGSSATRSV
jgi:hypothetical protein